MTKKNRLLDRIDVREPCTESWEEMTGNDEVRFCSHCSKNVFDLSAYTRQRAEKLVRDSNGSLCVRYRKDERGRVVTAPPRFTQIKRHAKIAAGVLATTLSFASMTYSQGEPISLRSKAEVTNRDRDKQPKALPGFVLSGTVTDLHGALIPGATVLLIANAKTQRSTITNDEGVFKFADVYSADYSVEISYPNFKKLVVVKVRIDGDLMFEKPFILEVADGVEVVGLLGITEGEPIVCDDPPKVSSEIKLQEIANLPLSGTTFVTMGLTAGVAEKPVDVKRSKKSKKKLPK